MNTMRSFSALVILFVATSLTAQQRVKMCLEMMDWLARPHAADAQLNVFIHGPSDEVAAAVLAHGGLVKYSLPRIVNARVPVANILALANESAVVRFEFDMDRVQTLNDSARVKSRVNEVHMGLAPLPEGYDGEDVVVGIIDTGLDVAHPDFLNEDSTTRVLYYWDQGVPTGPLTPPQYGYGQAWDKAMIDDGQFEGAVDVSSHGTTVAGIAAGNGLGNGKNKGMAPKSDLIIVRFPSSGTTTAAVADAVNYIFTQADMLGKPAVVNISLGSFLGSHDGLDAAALTIADMVNAQPGRMVVCAAGNWNEWDAFHMRTNVTADTSFTWFHNNPQANFGNNVVGGIRFTVWADAEDLENVNYAIGADKENPYEFRGRTGFHNVGANVGVVLTDTLYSLAGHRLGVVTSLTLPRGDQYQLQIQIAQPDSNAYRFRFMTTGSGMFDVWSLRYAGTSQMLPYTWPHPQLQAVPTVDEYPPIANYVYPDNMMHIADSWACSDRTITVGNYINELSYTTYMDTYWAAPGTEGAITPSSSQGPTRDGRPKPDVAAPGDLTFSAASFHMINHLLNVEPNGALKLAQGGLHMRGGGTSASSPHVAGIVALYLEKCPLATHDEIQEALHTTAMTDDLTGPAPNSYWGFGRVDAFGALNTSNLDPFAISVEGADPFCEGELITLTGPDGFAVYEWSNGITENPLYYGEEGPISLTAYNSSYCAVRSDTLSFTVLPAPPTPIITVDGILLTSTEATMYQWYFNGQPVDGMDTQTIEAWANGDYHVVITAENGCTGVSEPVAVIITDIGEAANVAMAIWPSPARTELNIRTGSTMNMPLTVHDAQGKLVMETNTNGASQMRLPLEELVAGTYFLRIGAGENAVMHRFMKLP